MSDPAAVVRRHVEAFNARESEAELWSPTAEFVAPGAAISGRDGVLAFLGVFQAAFSDLRLELEELLVDGDAAAAEGTLTGTHDGLLRTPGGDLAATGKSINLRWGSIYRVQGSQLAAEHLFFDQLELLGQLGVSPG